VVASRLSDLVSAWRGEVASFTAPQLKAIGKLVNLVKQDCHSDLTPSQRKAIVKVLESLHGDCCGGTSGDLLRAVDEASGSFLLAPLLDGTGLRTLLQLYLEGQQRVHEFVFRLAAHADACTDGASCTRYMCQHIR
jgi:hypothetical protein